MEKIGQWKFLLTQFLTKDISVCVNVNVYLHMDMCSFIAEIGELQANHKGAFKQRIDKFLAQKKISSTVVFLMFFHISRAAIYLRKKARWKVLLAISHCCWQYHFDLNDKYMLVTMLVVHDKLYFTDERFLFKVFKFYRVKFYQGF